MAGTTSFSATTVGAVRTNPVALEMLSDETTREVGAERKEVGREVMVAGRAEGAAVVTAETEAFPSCERCAVSAGDASVFGVGVLPISSK